MKKTLVLFILALLACAPMADAQNELVPGRTTTTKPKTQPKKPVTKRKKKTTGTGTGAGASTRTTGSSAAAKQSYEKAEAYEAANDYANAFKYYKEAADAGYVDAYPDVILSYINGIGTAQNDAEAFKYAQKGAKAGSAVATYLLGLCYAQGIGTMMDLSAADDYYTKSAEMGEPYAYYLQGQLFEDLGFEENAAEAYRQGAALGDSECAGALRQLGGYSDGNSNFLAGRQAENNEDYAEAVRLYRLGADEGDADSMNRLGLCYFFGRGVDESSYSALSWFERAANQGSSVAMYNIGFLYEYGHVGDVDVPLAIEWYRMAAELGNESGQEALTRLNAK